MAYLIEYGLVPAILMIQPVGYSVQQIKRSQGWPYVEKARVEHKDPHGMYISGPAHLGIVQNIVVACKPSKLIMLGSLPVNIYIMYF